MIVEHTRQPRAELVATENSTDAEKPTETTASAYRFRMAVEPHKSGRSACVKGRADLTEKAQIGTQQENVGELIYR